LPAAALDLGAAAAHVRGGGVLGYPTETVYGFGGACTPEGVEALARLKRRERHKPFLVLAPSVEALSGLAWSEEARTLAGIFWPGAVTLVLSDPDGAFPPGIRSEAGTVAVRVSPHPVVQALMAAGTGAMTSTSANAPGHPPARTGAEARDAAIALGGGEEVLVLDAGPLPPSGPSTLVDCTASEPRVLREGTVPVARLRCALPQIRQGTP
jgi:L-threonylcarbamoyladenylate synthase